MTHPQGDGIVANRRSILKLGAASAALSAAGQRRVLGANERINLGFIGFGLIGKRHVLDFREEPGVSLAAISDVHGGRMDEGASLIGGSPRKYLDFRKLLDDPDIDAVVISTPDHWHALMTIMACAAGKDVYVEKPVSLFVREGQWMADVARRTGKIVQVGTQQRSGPHYQKARELLREGQIGKVTSVRIWSFRNIMPGFGNPPDEPVPPGLDYDLWLGPAPARGYNPNRALYHFRWFWDYSGGQMTNLGHHSLDIVHWFLGVASPDSVSSIGGRFSLEDNGETPDIQDALFSYKDVSVSWSHREASLGAAPARGFEFCGTKGSLMIDRKGFRISPDPVKHPEASIPRFGGGHPIGVATAGSGKLAGKSRTSAVIDQSGDEFDQFRRHAREFLECIRSRREPVSDIESGHRVSTACHLANIALRERRLISWDGTRQQIVDDPPINAQLMRPYRAPWDRVRDAIIR